MPEKMKLPPVVRAVVALGGATSAARAIGFGVTPTQIETWMRTLSIPVGYLRRVSKLSKIPLEEFLVYEESKLRSGAREDADAL